MMRLDSKLWMFSTYFDDFGYDNGLPVQSLPKCAVFVPNNIYRGRFGNFMIDLSHDISYFIDKYSPEFKKYNHVILYTNVLQRVVYDVQSKKMIDIMLNLKMVYTIV